MAVQKDFLYGEGNEKKIKTSPLLGQEIVTGSKEELLRAAASLLGRGGAISTPNPIMLTEALRNEQLSVALSRSLNIPDGVGIARAFAKRGIYTEVFPGVELAESLLRLGSFSLGIIGGKAGVAALAMAYLKATHSGTSEAFVMDGYSYKKEELVTSLEKTSPDIVFVCLGTPSQEILISELLPISPRTLFIGLGGSADIYSGTKRRAPKVFRKMGLEWLYRILSEPRRIKNIPALLDFLALTRLERRKNAKGKGGRSLYRG